MLDRIIWHVTRALFQLGLRAHFGPNSYKVIGYHSGRIVLPNDKHEPFMKIVVKRLLAERQGAFIDVGVNIGQTFTKVLAIEKSRTYIGFEPQMSCCFNVDQFIRANHLSNSRIIPIALSNSNNLSLFMAKGQADECASLVSGRNSAQDGEYVQCRVGDEVLSEMKIDSIAAIKIDVEGAELQVIQGLRDTLRQLRPPVIFEVLPNFSGVVHRVRHDEITCDENRSTAKSLAKEFQQLNYALFQIDEHNGNEFPIDEFELDDIDNFKGTSFIARPKT